MSKMIKRLWRRSTPRHRADALNPATPRHPWFELRQLRAMELADRA
ncbi:MAG TPA: hypothetical protein VNT53_10820 [Pseudolysinimonas sp.]|nr:hypothetical protein [Pseudolysinimonas sp.]